MRPICFKRHRFPSDVIRLAVWLYFRFTLREIADHLFTWGGDIRIEAPEELRAVMHERVLLALGSV